MNAKIKKNLLYIIAGGCALVGIVFMICLIVLNTKPVTLNREYKYVLDMGGGFGSATYVEANATFDDKYVTYTAFAGTESITKTSEYRINEGRMFVKVDADDWKLFGTINSFKIDVDKSISGAIGLDFNFILECSSSKSANVIYIVFTTLGLASGALLVGIKLFRDKRSKKVIELKSSDQ